MISATFGCSGQWASICWSTRAVVDLPTATEPARPITNGVRGWVGLSRKSHCARLQPAGRLDVQAEQAGEREVDLSDLVEIEGVAEPAELGDLLGAERVVGVWARGPPNRPGSVRRTARIAASSTMGGIVAGCSAAVPGAGPAGGSIDSRRMCGIVGYVGPQQAQDVIIEGLRRLEYRGYDSAGIALVHARFGGSISSDKRAGKLANLEKSMADTPLEASTRASGTRAGPPTARPTIATPTPIWAQPAESRWSTTASSRTSPPCAPSWSATGHDLLSETDTEVAAHLVERELLAGADLTDGDAASLPPAGRRVHPGRRRRPRPVAGGGRPPQLPAGRRARARVRTSSAPTWPPSSSTPARRSSSARTRS